MENIIEYILIELSYFQVIYTLYFIPLSILYWTQLVQIQFYCSITKQNV